MGSYGLNAILFLSCCFSTSTSPFPGTVYILFSDLTDFSSCSDVDIFFCCFVSSAKTSDEETIPVVSIVTVAVAASIFLVLYFELFPILSPSFSLSTFKDYYFIYYVFTPKIFYAIYVVSNTLFFLIIVSFSLFLIVYKCYLMTHKITTLR
ncbi:hypothetical protein S2E19_02801 [Bacillus mycoides]|nr:hypothetical protein S2E19_02801 [Bacillus mycoides]